MNILIKRMFCQTSQNLVNKIKTKKTIRDIKKLNGFLDNTVKDNKIISKINKTARWDNDFKEFLKDFKSKNKNFPNIIDLSRFNKDSDTYDDTAKKLNEEEKEILGEFEKRSLEKREDDFDVGKDLDKHLNAGIDNETLLNMQQFVYIILENKSTTNITRLNRVNTMHTTVFCGNGDGIIGYGKGRGMDLEVAMNNALNNCTKNIITINYDYLNSFVQDQKKKFMSVTLSMYRRKNFESWGNPILGHMIQLTGITSCGFKILYRKPRYLALTYLFFYIITENKTPKDLAELYGCKIQDLGFAKQTKAWDHNHLKL